MFQVETATAPLESTVRQICPQFKGFPDGNKTCETIPKHSDIQLDL